MLRRGLAIPMVLVTHDLDEAAMLADRISICSIVAARCRPGTPEEVLTTPE